MTGDVQPTHWDAALAQRWRAAGAWKDEPLGATFAAAAHRRADAVAIVDGDRRITFTELDELTRRLATVLRQHDVTPGSTVTVQLPSWWETIALVIAAWRIGAVANPVLPNLRHHEVSLITAEVDSRVLVVPGEFRGFDYVAMARDLACAPTVLVARTTAAAPFARPEAARGEYTLDDLVRDAEPASDAVLDALRPDPDAAALVLYTSGTTAGPKGAIHTHNTLRAEVDGIEVVHECSERDVILATMPIAHVGGMLYAVLMPLTLGLRVALLDTWDPDVAVRLAASEGVTMLVGLPVMLQSMLMSPAYSADALHAVRLFALGGSRITAADVEYAADALGCWSKRSYGSTEMPTATSGPRHDAAGRLASTDGIPIGPTEVRVVDDHERDVPTGERGEILCRGPEMFVGYVDPALNESAFTPDGWFRTGDVGVLDADGFLVVVDRKKDIIIRGGENISAQEVEELLLVLPEIEDVAVVAMPDAAMGERACAFVVFGPDPLELADLVEHLRSRGVAAFKLPERLEPRAEFPRTATGKIRKDVLRAEIADLVAQEALA